MAHNIWKTGLIRFAHLEVSGQPMRLATRSPSSRTILGRTLHKRITMTPSTSWHKQIKGDVRLNEAMSQHTSLRIGGPADVFIQPRGLDDLRTVLRHRGEAPLFILGEGSNLLVSDRGIRGIVVSLKPGFKTIATPEFFVDEGGREAALLRVEAGVKMSYLVKFAAKYSLTGIEDLVGVPGSLGGALVMNAGAEATEISQVVETVTFVSPDGKTYTCGRDAIRFRYREAVFPKPGGIIVSAELKLYRGNAAAIQGAIDRHLQRRAQKQPLSQPNSGSIFKNPPGDTAGRLIEAAGLKGYAEGKASISIKHANFLINQGGAKAADALAVIRRVQEIVQDKFAVVLEPEVVIAGDWGSRS
ncbi:MAG: UDP-N-acetylmuramate dehydrogenase [Nitrospinaceae bacterium]